ncbi:hypothetical protein SAMN05192583_0074 [Sphingomonas gellani]|uniref:Uncharacterized protein n=1 Tax=Sphingomonas gellani TaxID=1166340 RepID=A0A1H7Y389_9SPHN|nr:hypothetical protein [Sphingomonas gellani]SEM40590.1 hypothetical protein SAMN05192583_0074 [Sphingomonas gellani]
MALLLSRSALLSAKLPTRDVPVPEMGPDAEVRIQQMSVNTRTAYFERIWAYQDAVRDWEFDQALPADERKGLTEPAPLDMAILAIVHSIIDENGQTIFTEQDIPIFGQWSKLAVTRIYEAVNEINHYDKNPNALIEAEKKD